MGRGTDRGGQGPDPRADHRRQRAASQRPDPPGAIKPDEVSVELYFGPLDARGLITTGNSASLTCEGSNGSMETYRYSGAIPCEYSGQYGYALRIVPSQPQLAARYHVGLVRWG